MKIKTNTLTRRALDWAVATCKDLPLKLDPMGFRKDAPDSMQAGWWVWDGEGRHQVIGHRKILRNQEDGYSPSTDWSQGGPIIDEYDLELMRRSDPVDKHSAFAPDSQVYGIGPTKLIAAMRCVVAMRFGDEVDVPEELLK